MTVETPCTLLSYKILCQIYSEIIEQRAQHMGELFLGRVHHSIAYIRTAPIAYIRTSYFLYM